jgi:hypothetical protein
MANSDVKCWPGLEREMYAMWILNKHSFCPICASSANHKSRRKGLLEQILQVVFSVSPLLSRPHLWADETGVSSAESGSPGHFLSINSRMWAARSIDFFV